jgi:type IV secretion system protein VirB6
MLAISASFSHNYVFAGALYSDCIYGFEFGNDKKDSIDLRPVGRTCYNTCNDACTSTFSVKENDEELNQDIIYECMRKCQNGETYSAQRRLGKDPNFDITKTYSSGLKDVKYKKDSSAKTNLKKCDALQSPNTSDLVIKSDSVYAPYATSVEVKRKADGSLPAVTIEFPLGDDSENGIAMCGSATKMIEPTYYSLTDNDSTWNSIPDNSWHAQNPNRTLTGLKVLDGDFLKIEYSGLYANYVNRITTDIAAEISAKTIFPTKRDGNRYYYEFNKYSEKVDEVPAGRKPNALLDIYKGSTRVSILPPTELSLNLDNSVSGSNVYASNAAICDNTNPDSTLCLGLKGVTWLKEETRGTNGKAYYQAQAFAGFLKGFSSDTRQELGIRHHLIVGNSNYQDNAGGLSVKIDWKGCLHRKQQLVDILEYTLVKKEDGYKVKWKTAWEPVPLNSVDAGGNIVFIPKMEGKLYLRIKPKVAQEIAGNTDYHISNRFGYIPIKVRAARDIGDSIVGNIVRKLRVELFGTSQKPGVVQRIFTTFLHDTNLISGIRALLVLYITVLGLGFLVGTIQLTQREAVIAIIKVSLIVVLTSQRSWEFFNTYLFSLFTDGFLSILAEIILAIDGTTWNAAEIRAEPSRVFDVFDHTLRWMLSVDAWAKIISLFFSGIFGAFMGIALMVGVLRYVYAIIKAIIIYLMSIIVVGLLLVIAPIFLCFMLFKTTFSMFDGWIKQLISFSLQPILVFTMVALLFNVLILLFKLSLQFTVCKVCWVSFFDIWCLISTYVSVYGAHSPSADAYLPPLAMSQMAAIFSFVLVVQAMVVLSEKATDLAKRLATSSFVGADLGSDPGHGNKGTVSSIMPQQLAAIPFSMGAFKGDPLARMARFGIGKALTAGKYGLGLDSDARTIRSKVLGGELQASNIFGNGGNVGGSGGGVPSSSRASTNSPPAAAATTSPTPPALSSRSDLGAFETRLNQLNFTPEDSKKLTKQIEAIRALTSQLPSLPQEAGSSSRLNIPSELTSANYQKLEEALRESGMAPEHATHVAKIINVSRGDSAALAAADSEARAYLTDEQIITVARAVEEAKDAAEQMEQVVRDSSASLADPAKAAAFKEYAQFLDNQFHQLEEFGAISHMQEITHQFAARNDEMLQLQASLEQTYQMLEADPSHAATAENFNEQLATYEKMLQEQVKKAEVLNEILTQELPRPVVEGVVNVEATESVGNSLLNQQTSELQYLSSNIKKDVAEVNNAQETLAQYEEIHKKMERIERLSEVYSKVTEDIQSAQASIGRAGAPQN